jgi:acetyltransferase-like isoleucine patch superfamily enzyme
VEPITIERNVWIGTAATVLPGVTIGADSVVGAGAVVTHDVPPATLVAGVPATVIRHL